MRSVVVSTLFQLMTVAALLYLRTLGAPDWLAGLMLILAVGIGVVVALIQRWKEIKGGEEDEAKKY